MKPATSLSSGFLLLVAIGHGLRLILGLSLTVDRYTIPMWPSGIAVLGAGGLAVWLWREQRPAS
jgi:hypothetical protein